MEYDQYIVTEPVIVNGVHRFRGDKLTGADAQAINKRPMLRKRVVPDRHGLGLCNCCPKPASKAPVSVSAPAAEGK